MTVDIFTILILYYCNTTMNHPTGKRFRKSNTDGIGLSCSQFSSKRHIVLRLAIYNNLMNNNLII